MQRRSLIRILCTVINIFSILKTSTVPILLDRLSTHPYECFFGLTCHFSHDKEFWSDLERTISNTIMSYECLDQLKMTISIQKLDNKAGLIFDPYDKRKCLLHQLQTRNFVLASFHHIEDYETIEKLSAGPLDYQPLWSHHLIF